MVFRSFRIQVIFRTLMLATAMGGALYLLFCRELPATTFIMVSVTVLLFINLVRYIEKTRRELALFLNSIRYDDFLDSYPILTSEKSRKKKHYDELHEAFAGIVKNFQEVRIEREEQYRFLDTVIQHIAIGVIIYSPDGIIERHNNAIRRLLGVQRLSELSDIEPLHPALASALQDIQPGKRQVVEILVENRSLQLSLDGTIFRSGSKLMKLVSVQDIRNELEEKEMEAWQSLMRVLTHEIRNSIAPIASLAGSAEELLAPVNSQIDEDDLDDIKLAIGTIGKRSKGLLKFVETFRQFYQIPNPSFEIIPIKTWFANLEAFFRNQAKNANIEMTFWVEPESLELTADTHLAEQVMINLILNAIQAVTGRKEPRVNITARLNEQGRVEIDVIDNGPGIQPEVVKKIFVPFFSTRAGGSGIGLSLSKRIMKLHNGTIFVQSTPNEGSQFTLMF